MEMNDDLISRKALLEEFDRVCVDGVMAHGANVNLEIEFVRAVQKAPAVDPHKHGRWISVKDRLPEDVYKRQTKRLDCIVDYRDV